MLRSRRGSTIQDGSGFRFNDRLASALSRELGRTSLPGSGTPAYQPPGARMYPCVGSVTELYEWAGKLIDALHGYDPILGLLRVSR